MDIRRHVLSALVLVGFLLFTTATSKSPREPPARPVDAGTSEVTPDAGSPQSEEPPKESAPDGGVR
jgi:hypothetical protein